MTYPGILLKKQQLMARKELGQNFLSDPNAARMIVTKAGISDQDRVLEIGPGLGALTIPAAKLARDLVAVEKDTRLAGILMEELKRESIENVELINNDILHQDLNTLFRGEKIIVIGNLPYNISSQVLFMLVENRHLIKRAVLMFQKELTERISASPGGRDYGRLSVVMQYCSTVKKIADLPPHLFFPKPAVDSRVIEVNFFETTPYSGERERFLFKVIKAAFSKRRKTLRNSLAGGELDIDTKVSAKILETAEIDPVRRAETLSVEEYSRLSDALWSMHGSEEV
ncbi:KsgA [Desulforapulum autotrophicum HRM2]|uniref:Ribosomal RNA small subunit methyltransferase A n=2 Tax=Desulforapulum autotrophicum TaxID=2296 RepID=RSMA_DESAH|nr:RecName: Full=Ribosomal RNA small subunit methyltransferase A; AltName: Full=16S rRNA (adenine(1518)-N(6)/adenine(1519)-N(6))-dimethyltransferase; AltName: Full=16S rRNA dimethyladenosine transferase; AltName: Full=16S rRNA dimethylase; AltName: Full=S-adenosylmethionine-6-N', N'-adenosyl(rRNA) dimethyltransferase [Desulforapulum autotrophicum HRM2]ACN13388.1 KsgA [Desulforapulum autotrophicum HRM2]